MKSQTIPATILSTLIGLTVLGLSPNANATLPCGCEEPKCGDGHKDPGEECDDGNTKDGDGCDSECKKEPYCGDGCKDPYEECDDGNKYDGDGCDSECKKEPVCGDGHKDPYEECDDGNKYDGDGCDSECKKEPVCGDGCKDPYEECDDGNTKDGDGCSSKCKKEPFCGDGHKDKWEECDDGNKKDGDGCSKHCKVEPCKDSDKDWVCNKDDKCPYTDIPEKYVPTKELNPNHWALIDGDEKFDTVKKGKGGPKKHFTIHDTKGCSCEQIIEEQGLGEGHTKHGCSNSAIEDWIKKVSGYKMEGDDGMGMNDLEAPEEIPEEELEEIEEIEEFEELEEIPEELDELDLSGTPEMNCNVDSGNGSGPVLAFIGLVLAAFGRRRWS